MDNLKDLNKNIQIRGCFVSFYDDHCAVRIFDADPRFSAAIMKRKDKFTLIFGEKTETASVYFYKIGYLYHASPEIDISLYNKDTIDKYESKIHLVPVLKQLLGQ